jgi:acyl-CoA synthetase (AMP-forming)/AMP-acid ligase II
MTFTTQEDRTVTAIVPAVQTSFNDLIIPPTRPSYDSGISDVPLLGDILDAQVVGVPDVKYGEELCAWVKLRPGAEPLTAERVREFAAGKLARYKIPRYVIEVDEFPLTVTGKVRKLEMRERSIRLLSLEEAAALRHA